MSNARRKKNTKLIAILAAVAVVIVAALVIWGLTGSGDAGMKTVEVQVVHGDGSTRDFTLKTEEETLGRALVEGEVVVDNQSTYGLYIQTVDGETANEANQEWWCLTKGGESVNTGADEVVIADGEHYELTLTVGYDF